MLKLRTILVLCAILTVCYCDGMMHHKYKKKKKHHHGYDLFLKGGLFWYFTFLALKIKAVLVLGTIFTIGLIVGKAFALIKFAEYMKNKEEPIPTNNDHHDEKIVFVNPHSDNPGLSYYDSHGPPSGPPTPYNGHSSDLDASGSSHNHAYQSFPPGYSVDKPPPGAIIHGNGDAMPMGDPNGPVMIGGSNGVLPSGQSYAPPGMPYGPPDQSHGGGQGYDIQASQQVYYGMMQQDGQSNGGQQQQQWNGRSQQSVGGVYEAFETFITIIRKLNVTDVIFKKMGIQSDDCKRKFVCEAEYNAKQSIILKTAFRILSDDNYMRYRPNKTIEDIEECETLNSGCNEHKI